MTGDTRPVRDQVAEVSGDHQPEHHSGYLTGEPDYFTCTGCGWRSDDDLDDIAQQFETHTADAILALPVVAEAFAALAERDTLRATVGRVRALADEWEWERGRVWFADDLRRAVDGATQDAPAPPGSLWTCGTCGHQVEDDHDEFLCDPARATQDGAPS